MERTYIKDLSGAVGNEVTIAGYIDVRRDQGKLIFLDIRDMTGSVQGVILPSAKEALEVGKELRHEWVVEIKGKINKRPDKNIQAGKQNGDIEVEILGITILGRAKELPFEKDAEINLDTYLDFLPLTLRREKQRAVFKVQAEIVRLYRDFLVSEGFTEFQAPKLIGEDAEGGANSFNIEYFGHTAHLAQSPQLYKQIMVGVFERVFSAGNVYRAEKHSTSRHINEYTSLDIEMGFIKDHTDIMKMENKLLIYIVKGLTETCAKEFELMGATIPTIPESIPAFKLRKAQEIIKKEYGADCSNEPDLEPQHERWLCEYAQKNFGSDFIFVTHFPVSKRPFYTYEDESDPGYTKGFDLLFRGIEITTGAQRIHDYDILVAGLEKKKLDPEKFAYYLQAFKYGMPPHGGFGMGLERLTAKFLGLDNVKEATLFPRDINRIDGLLSK
ncbi:MAG TPA: aspartate--tRNA(Asn) ligase [Candidatus Paceibacterota bacterium]|nr:aspartate--tRNA(Asn) ligase [Candidatus Paceibacterota bacterium]